jgi:hypothetical protein
MKAILAILVGVFAITGAAAQTSQQGATPPALREPDGRTNLPDHQKNLQQSPQGPTGPLDTTTGGAPAESPQGQTPPGMQSAPEGSSKTIVGPKQ